MEDISDSFKLPWENPVLIFSLILLIILLAPVVLNRLKIPGIIGLIASGIAIGPYGLRLLEKGLFVEVFSTVGLLYIMFIAGLELDLNEFRAHRKKSLVFGFFTFIIPLTIGFPVCYYLLGYDFYASLLTASMFSTHTLLTYPIVSRLRVSKNRSVAIAVGGTILTDTTVLILLAVIVGAFKGGLTQAFWFRLIASMAIFLAIMFFIIPRIAKWFFEKMASEKYAHYIFVLFVVFLAAFMAQLAGVEAIIGAFVSGLALNRLIPRTSVLFNRIEFIGNALFIPFFLISVGMLVDVSILFTGPAALIVALSLIVVAIAGKWLAAFLTQLAIRYTASERQLIFGLSNSHAAATLAIILVGYKEKILDINILNGTILLILVTCVVASFATELAAKKIVLASETDYSSQNSNSRTKEQLLLPIVNTANMEKALEFAVLIRDTDSVAPIAILTVVPNNEEAEKNILSARHALEDFINETTAAETPVDIIATIDFNAPSGIARAAKEIMADIIILGWPRRSGFMDKLVGDKISIVLNNSAKTLFICQFLKPLANHDRLILIIPPLAELEDGFSLWLRKLARLATELGTPTFYHCNTGSEKAITESLKTYRINSVHNFMRLAHWETFLNKPPKAEPGDLFGFIAAREGSVSYSRAMENLPARTETHFSKSSKIVVYPS